jgi:radical SAM superfamily enzyme with C-terminal helix-hairpin-helix motif
MEFKNLFVDFSDYVYNEDKTIEVLKLLVRRDSIEGVKIQRATETSLKEVFIFTKERQNPISFKSLIDDSMLEKMLQDISGKGKEIGFSP